MAQPELPDMLDWRQHLKKLLQIFIVNLTKIQGFSVFCSFRDTRLAAMSACWIMRAVSRGAYDANMLQKRSNTQISRIDKSGFLFLKQSHFRFPELL